ncbi:MAG: XRE family transcriptional regulator [Bacteroidales bacterium]|nr:XRE family transcriptional regulator [Bacteroidales bacterium]
MHIGQRVKEVVTQQGRSVSWLAKQIHCDRTNVYLIFKRASIDTDLLQRLSVVLEYDFFQDLSEETNAKKETR